MNEKDLLERFIDYCNRKGYGSAYDQKECIEAFLILHIHNDTWIKKIMNESEKNPLSNMDLYTSISKENMPEGEIWLVNKETKKIMGKLVNIDFKEKK